jgi:hypothetical protein
MGNLTIAGQVEIGLELDLIDNYLLKCKEVECPWKLAFFAMIHSI